MTDEELMQQIKQRPDEGIEQVIRQYGPLIKGVIIKIAGYEKEIDVQECMSQVFVRLWQYGESFDAKKGTLRSYLITIARNEALRALRYLQTQESELLIEDYDIGMDMDMTHEVARKMNKSIVHEIVEHLKEPDRQIFVRRYFFGERIKTIALEMQLEGKFVENRIYLVKKKMKKQLIERGVIL